MGSITMGLALQLLQAVPKVVAAAPDFKRVFDSIVATFSGAEQDDLKAAYDAAISDAADAHQDLQEIVDRNS
jgi:ABC-type transporter Mla subunit MlaD